MSEIQQIENELKARFNAEATQNERLTFQFQITDADDFYIHINDGQLEVNTGEAKETDVVLISDQTTLLGIMKGEVNGMQAFMSGKLKTEGNIMLANKLNNFFSA